MAKKSTLGGLDIDIADLETAALQDTAEDQDDPQEPKGEEDTEKKDETDEDAEKDKSKGKKSEDSKDDEEDESDDDSEDSEDDDSNENDDEGDEPPVVSIANELLTEFGIETDEKFEDTKEGLVSAVKQLTEKSREEFINQLFDAYPTAGQLLQFEMNGGRPEQFLETVRNQNIEKIKLGEDNVLLQKQILEQKLTKEGLTQTDIDEAIEEAEKSGTLFKQSSRALKVLQANAKIEREHLMQDQAKRAEAEKREAMEEAKQVKTIVQKGKIGNVQITEAEKQDFLNFLYQPVDHKGTTRSQLARKELSLDQALLMEYLVYKKADVSKLAVTTAKSKKVQSLRDRLKENKKDANPTKGLGGRQKRKDHTQQAVPTIQDIL